MVWNLRVCQGLELQTPPAERPPLSARSVAPVRLPALPGPDDAKIDGEPDEAEDDGRSPDERRLDARREIADALAGIVWRRRLRPQEGLLCMPDPAPLMDTGPARPARPAGASRSTCASAARTN
jgi:hypothetical protein